MAYHPEPIYAIKGEFERSYTVPVPKSFVVYGFSYRGNKYVAVEARQCETMKPISYWDVFDYSNVTIAGSTPVQTKLVADNIAMVSPFGLKVNDVWNGKTHPIALLTCDGSKKFASVDFKRCEEITLHYDSATEEIIFQCHPRVSECKRHDPHLNYQALSLDEQLQIDRSAPCKQQQEIMRHMRDDMHDLLLMSGVEVLTETV